MEHLYDVLIVGGGPAGYTAALYCARASLDALVLEQLSAGGQMASTTQVDNYPGFHEGIDGFELGGRMQAQAHRFGASTRLLQVQSAKLNGPVKELHTSEGALLGRSVILAPGAVPRRLDLPREQALTGRGVHYCAACDGMAYRGKDAAVVGGGNSAAEDALTLSRICRSVTVIHRRDSLRSDKIYQDALFRAGNVTFLWNRTVQHLLGEERLEGVMLRDAVSGQLAPLSCDSLFVSIGRVPDTQFLRSSGLSLDPSGYIPAGESAQTELPGVFAAGDVRTKPLRQIVTAAADGAAAAHSAQAYLSGRAPG